MFFCKASGMADGEMLWAWITWIHVLVHVFGASFIAKQKHVSWTCGFHAFCILATGSLAAPGSLAAAAADLWWSTEAVASLECRPYQFRRWSGRSQAHWAQNQVFCPSSDETPTEFGSFFGIILEPKTPRSSSHRKFAGVSLQKTAHRAQQQPVHQDRDFSCLGLLCWRLGSCKGSTRKTSRVSLCFLQYVAISSRMAQVSYEKKYKKPVFWPTLAPRVCILHPGARGWLNWRVRRGRIDLLEFWASLEWGFGVISRKQTLESLTSSISSLTHHFHLKIDLNCKVNWLIDCSPGTEGAKKNLVSATSWFQLPKMGSKSMWIHRFRCQKLQTLTFLESLSCKEILGTPQIWCAETSFWQQSPREKKKWNPGLVNTRAPLLSHGRELWVWKDLGWQVPGVFRGPLNWFRLVECFGNVFRPVGTPCFLTDPVWRTDRHSKPRLKTAGWSPSTPWPTAPWRRYLGRSCGRPHSTWNGKMSYQYHPLLLFVLFCSYFCYFVLFIVLVCCLFICLFLVCCVCPCVCLFVVCLLFVVCCCCPRHLFSNHFKLRKVSLLDLGATICSVQVTAMECPNFWPRWL